ncbi:hypothetical protein HPP92_013938, partial [Vanilla planifolia]
STARYYMACVPLICHSSHHPICLQWQSNGREEHICSFSAPCIPWRDSDHGNLDRGTQ